MKITARACRASERTGRLPACCLVRGRRSTTSREFREVGQSRKDKEKKTVCLFDKKTANSLRHRLGRFAGGVPAASAPVPPPAAVTAAATASCAVGSTAAASTHSASGTTAKASLFSFFADSTSLPFASTTGVQRSTRTRAGVNPANPSLLPPPNTTGQHVRLRARSLSLPARRHRTARAKTAVKPKNRRRLKKKTHCERTQLHERSHVFNPKALGGKSRDVVSPHSIARERNRV